MVLHHKIDNKKRFFCYEKIIWYIASFHYIYGFFAGRQQSMQALCQAGL